MSNHREIKRYVIVALCVASVAVATLLFTEPAWAGAFSDLAKEANTNGWRAGKSMTICPIKLAILLLLYFCWVATTSWCNNDAELLGDPRRSTWNGANLLAFVLTFLAALFIPIYWIGMPLVLLSWLVPIFIYIKARNASVPTEADKVMTPSHLFFWFRTKVLRQKVKPKALSYQGGSPIQLEAAGMGLDPAVKTVREVDARNEDGSLGYNYFRELLYHAIHARATDVLINFGAEETHFQYQIDGVYHPVTDAFKKPWTREEANSVAKAVKLLTGGNPDDRRNYQKGLFKMLYDKNAKGKPFVTEANVESMGVPNGETMHVAFVLKTATLKTLDAIGASEDRQELIKKLINADKGLVVLATAPHQGLKTLTTVIFNTADRFTRDFVGVEDVQQPYEVIENIVVSKYDSAKGETPMTVLPDVFFREPKVLLIRDMVNLDSWKLCCEEIRNDRLIITTFRGNDALSTIVELLKYGVDPKQLADSLSAVITQKLIRRLCPYCKEEVRVNDDMARKLGLDKTKPVIYRKRVHVPVEPGQKDYYVPCDQCRDIGYSGRVAIFDVLEITDDMRQVIAAPGDPDAKRVALQRLANSTQQFGYFIDGLRLVRAGTTSYEELMRSIQPATQQRAQTRPRAQQ
ncbi:MAG: ATPase, T2SS/T4P/T4SS family [Planctomycetia bacterium]|nr:ATPase, T2SS/T4P/T4SS family [Planctomycetia bacterium]